MLMLAGKEGGGGSCPASEEECWGWVITSLACVQGLPKPVRKSLSQITPVLHSLSLPPISLQALGLSSAPLALQPDLEPGKSQYSLRGMEAESSYSLCLGRLGLFQLPWTNIASNCCSLIRIWSLCTKILLASADPFEVPSSFAHTEVDMIQSGVYKVNYW